MNLKIKAKVLRDAIKAVNALVEEATFHATDAGISLKAMDASQITMVFMEIPKDVFLEYPTSIDERFCLDISRLVEVLSRTKDEMVEIETDTQMTMRFVGEGRKRTFKLPLLESETQTRKEPKVEHESFVVVDASLLDAVIKDSQLAGDHINFETTDVFKAFSHNETNDFIAEYEPCETVVFEGKAKAMFPVKFLVDMLKATEGATRVKLNLSTDRPMKMEYNLDDVKVAYWLAPRIDNQ